MQCNAKNWIYKWRHLILHGSSSNIYFVHCTVNAKLQVTRYHCISKDNFRTVMFHFLLLLSFCILVVISLAIYCHAISCVLCNEFHFIQLYSWVRPAWSTPRLVLEVGGTSTLQAVMPEKLESPPLQAQVLGVHDGPTQLYIIFVCQ